MPAGGGDLAHQFGLAVGIDGDVDDVDARMAQQVSIAVEDARDLMRAGRGQSLVVIEVDDADDRETGFAVGWQVRVVNDVADADDSDTILTTARQPRTVVKSQW